MITKKNNFLKILILFSVFITSSLSSQCIVDELAKDLSRNPALKELLSANKKNFDAWTLLFKKKPSIRSSTIEIKFVAENIKDVNKLGGYTKWKNYLDELLNKIPSNFFKNANFKNADELANTFDPKGKLSKHHRGLIFNYYQQAIKGNKPHLWKKIEDIFNEYKLNGGWPPANGGYNAKNKVRIVKGQKFDRYQQWFKLEDGKPVFGGAFTSPVENGKFYSYTQRALKGAETDYAIRYEIEILKDLPIDGQLSTIIPWFGQKGGGKQLLFNFDRGGKYKSFKELIDDGYIKVTIKDIPSNNKNLLKFKGKSFGGLANGVDDALSKLLKNTDYKKFYDDLASGATPRRFANELTIQEEAVLKFYTNKSYYNFNQALINGSKADEILEVEKLLNNTLDKIPSSAGTYYRGIGKIEIDKLSTYKIGDEVPYDNFLSTSSELDEAAKFARKNHSKTGEGAMIIIESKNGKSIKRYSDAEFEYEVLHKSGSKFTLTKVEDNILLNVFEHQFDDYPAVYGKRYTLVEK